jgi:lactate permease
LSSSQKCWCKINSYFLLLAAAAPLLAVLYLMIVRQWNSSRAGVVGWLTAVALALILFGGDGRLVWVSFGKAILLSLFVLYIIWMALLLYHVVNEAGAVAVLGRELPLLAPDRPGQAVLLGWVFGSFLQGASGYGIPAAIVAPLLAGLGFAANTAVVVALLGHGWAVTFGSLGASFFSLIAATDWPGHELAGPSAALLAVACLACGFGALWATGRWAAVRRRWLLLLLLTGVMAGVQGGLALAGFWSLAAFGAGMAGLVVAIFYFQLANTFWPVKDENGEAAAKPSFRLLAQAVAPYLLLTLIILFGQTIWQQPLNVVRLNWHFPAVVTRLGWHTPAEPGQSISLFGHAGALLLYAALLSFAWYRRRGTFRPETPYSGRLIWRKTVRGATGSSISIGVLLAMSVTMQHAGMTQLLAEGLSQGTGAVFPLLSPYIGALGAFMTGSNTNSNVVFGLLQQKTAVALGLSVPFVLAGQTAGGAIGSLFAPAKVVVGCSTVAGSSEAQVLKAITTYGLVITAIISVGVWLFA